VDYHHDRERSAKHYSSSPTSYSSNGAASPRAGYHQERESRSSNRSMRSQGGQGSEGGDSRRHRSSRSGIGVSSPHSQSQGQPSSKPSPGSGHPSRSSASAHYGAGSPHNGTTSVPQDGNGTFMMQNNNNHYDDSGVSSQGHQAHSQQVPITSQYEGGVAAVTPSPPGDVKSNSHLPHVSSSYSQGSSQSKRPAYLLHRDLVIGKGSYGQVCIASRGEAEGHMSSTGTGKRKKFACKCVVLRNDAKYIAKLQEEVNVLRELRGHENIIRLYDVFCVDNELFIITELGRGGDLFHLLTTHPKHGVTEAYAAKTVAQMLSSVAFLHCRQICHRDLKLENWVLESGKDVWSPLKLIDFGLSTHFTPGHRLSRVVGSSYYVAPEVLKKSYTEACDLWSLGVIVYMLLSGAPPFYGKNDEAIKASIVQGEYTFPHELFRDVSDEAMAFVSTLLSYNIEYRYTAEQALTHPWLAVNCDPALLQRAKDGARGAGSIVMNQERGMEPMQM